MSDHVQRLGGTDHNDSNISRLLGRIGSGILRCQYSRKDNDEGGRER